MSLKQQLADDLKDGMRQGDDARKTTLRLLMAAITRAEIPGADVDDPNAARQDFDDAQVLAVIAAQAKQRRQSIDAFEKAARQDLVDKETVELHILEAYLPSMMSAAEIAAEARKVITEVGATGPGDKGKVMKALVPRLAGRADGRAINEVVSDLLAKLG